LIDEYQDISMQRLKLIKKILERNPNSKLFCVGDDWQSIMGFSGSNLDFFVNFKNYFDNPAISKICTNYRSIKSIVDAGTELIRKNKSCQIQKPTLSNHQEIRPITVLRSPHKVEYEQNYYRQIAEDCLGRINGYLKRGYAPGEILILSRYMRTQVGGKTNFLPVPQAFIEKARKMGVKVAFDDADTSSRIRLLTVHKCKGLEAKVVFVLNVVKGTFGFPCEIEDLSILEPARLNYPKQSLKEEERRLFYVAMTRAKEDLYIYTWEPAKSEFIDEIKGHANEVRLSY
jgi:DNA helicase-4